MNCIARAVHKLRELRDESTVTARQNFNRALFGVDKESLRSVGPQGDGWRGCHGALSIWFLFSLWRRAAEFQQVLEEQRTLSTVGEHVISSR